MKMLKLLALLIVMAIIAALAYTPTRAADSFTVTAVGDTMSDIGTGWINSFKVLKLAWKSGTDGVKVNETVPAMKGKLYMVVTDPGTAPTDNYDMYIKDATGVDVLNGMGENRDTVNSEQIMPKWGTDAYHPRPIYGSMTFSMSGNSADSATGDVYLYFGE